MQEYSFQQVWSEVGAAITRIRSNLDEAIAVANDDSGRPELLPCPIRWASVVRGRLGVTIPVALADDDFVLETGFNTSLTVHGMEKALRILKAQVNDLPSASSPGRKWFFNQGQSQQPGFDFDEDEPEEPVNRFAPHFVLVWAVEHGRLVSLILAYPKPTPEVEFGQPTPAQEWYWVEQVLTMTRDETGTPEFEEFIDLDNVEPLEGDGPDPDKQTGTGS